MPSRAHLPQNSCPQRRSRIHSRLSATLSSPCSWRSVQRRRRRLREQGSLRGIMCMGALRAADGSGVLRPSSDVDVLCTPGNRYSSFESRSGLQVTQQTWMESMSTEKTRAPSFASSAASGRPTTSDLCEINRWCYPVPALMPYLLITAMVLPYARSP